MDFKASFISLTWLVEMGERREPWQGNGFSTPVNDFPLAQPDPKGELFGTRL
jgi:hypothetical protein